MDEGICGRVKSSLALRRGEYGNKELASDE